MVRGGLKFWFGVAGVVLVIVALTAIALNRIDDAPSDGRWNLARIETPVESVDFGDSAWLIFDGNQFTGQVECRTFDGQVSGFGSSFNLVRFGYTNECDDFGSRTAYFEDSFHVVSSYFVDDGVLSLQSDSGSVQMTFVWAGNG